MLFFMFCIHVSFLCHVSVRASISYIIIRSLKDGPIVFCPIIPFISKNPILKFLVLRINKREKKEEKIERKETNKQIKTRKTYQMKRMTLLDQKCEVIK